MALASHDHGWNDTNTSHFCNCYSIYGVASQQLKEICPL